MKTHMLENLQQMLRFALQLRKMSQTTRDAKAAEASRKYWDKQIEELREKIASFMRVRGSP